MSTIEGIMSDLIPKLDISYLIVKALNGELEGTEEQKLKEWLDESEENKVLYLRVQMRKNRDQRLEVIRKLNKREAWKRIDHGTREHKYFIFKWIYRGVAVAIPMILLFSLYYNKLDRIDRELVKQEQREIHPGEMKAELILANGQCLVLDARKENSIESELEGVRVS